MNPPGHLIIDDLNTTIPTARSRPPCQLSDTPFFLFIKVLI